MFDWAAQPFFTVVTTFIFGPYFISRMASDPATGQAAWGYGIAAGGFLIAILSPVLGSIADQTGPRKPWIGFFAVIKILALSGLWFAAPGSSLVGVVALFTLASVAAEFSIVFNDSMLLRLVPKAAIGRLPMIAAMLIGLPCLSSFESSCGSIITIGLPSLTSKASFWRVPMTCSFGMP